MKRFLIIAMSLFMLLSCAACGDGTEDGGESVPANTVTVDFDVINEVDAKRDTFVLEGGQFYSSKASPLDEDLIRAYFGDATAMPDFGAVEEYAVYIDESKPLKPCEFGLFKMKEGADKEAFLAFLKARIDMKIQNSIAYPAMDTEPLKTAKFTIKGDYVWYCAVNETANNSINSDWESKING